MAIDSFRGNNAIFSNFNGLLKITAEHVFQALKGKDWDDILYVLAADSPSEAKNRGNQIPIREDWDEIKEEVMWCVIQIKFAPGTSAAQFLLGTGDEELIEGNRWGDRFWGAEWDKELQEWIGQNVLGKLLMNWREMLREEETNI